MASIHNAIDYNHSLAAIANGAPLFRNKDIWIGLNDIKREGEYQWTDHSAFDFATNISGGQYPWKYNSPNNANANNGGQHCVQYAFRWHYRWDDTECDNLDKVLCNTCDSVIHRYIIIHHKLYWNEAHEYCMHHIGAPLASIFSLHHYEEAMFLCTKNEHDKICWIGSLHAEDKNHQTVRYEINTSIGNIDTVSHEERKYFICDAPSEIDITQQWLVIDNTMAVIADKQWINTNGKLVIEYMYTVDECAGDCGVGILIFSQNSLCYGYYIAISYGEHIYLSKSQIYGTQWMESERVKLNYTLDTLWRSVLLRVEVINHTTYVVLVNNVQHMVYHVVDANDTMSLVDNALSGYIGIKRVEITVESESLHISGSKMTTDGAESIKQCSIRNAEKTSTVRTTWEGVLVWCIIMGIAVIIICIALLNENKTVSTFCTTQYNH